MHPDTPRVLIPSEKHHPCIRTSQCSTDARGHGRRAYRVTKCKRKDPPGTIPGVRRHYAFDFATVDPRLLYTFYLVFTKHPISSTTNPTLLDIRHVSPSRHQSRCLYKSRRLRNLAFLHCIPPFYSTSYTAPLPISYRRESHDRHKYQ
jgi:hypothetical protein